MRTRIFLCLVILLFIPISVVNASECTYGSVHAWFRTSDGTWKNATAHPWLQRGEEFEIKIIVNTKTNLQVFFIKLHEFGTPVFEVIEGPTQMEQLVECRQKIVPNQTFTYVWKMRVLRATTWVNGYAPLEINAQFNKNDTDECRIGFDIIIAFIEDTLGRGVQQNNTFQADSSEKISRNFSSVEVASLLITIFLLCILKRLRSKGV